MHQYGIATEKRREGGVVQWENVASDTNDHNQSQHIKRNKKMMCMKARESADWCGRVNVSDVVRIPHISLCCQCNLWREHSWISWMPPAKLAPTILGMTAYVYNIEEMAEMVCGCVARCGWVDLCVLGVMRFGMRKSPPESVFMPYGDVKSHIQHLGEGK